MTQTTGLRHVAAAAILCIALLIGASCSREPTHSVRRLAILPANILIADPASDWMSLAVPVVLQQDLATAHNVTATVTANESTVYQLASTSGLQTEELRTTVENRGGRFTLDASVSDLSTERTRQVFTRSSTSIVSALDGIAKQVDPAATDFPTRNERALQSFVAGISAADTSSKIARLNDAVTADHSFGLAYVALAQSLVVGNRAQMLAVLGNAALHRASFTAVDKVRFDLLRSRLLGAPLAEQTSAAKAVVELLPNDVDGLASLASNLFLSGNDADAQRLMNRAIAINPDDINLRQQLAVGLIAVKQFGKAEKVLRSIGSPAILPQLASCILLQGDTARANTVFENFLASVGDPDARLLLRASWQALAGNRPEAIRQLSSAQFHDGRVAALAKGQLIVWELLERRYDEAEAISASAPPLALVLAQGAASAQELQSKVNSISPSQATPEAKTATLRDGYFLLGFYPEAVEAWKQADRQAGGTDLRARAMLAASLNAAGQKDAARKVPVQPFTPDFSDFYSAVSFSQMRLLISH